MHTLTWEDMFGFQKLNQDAIEMMLREISQVLELTHSFSLLFCLRHAISAVWLKMNQIFQSSSLAENYAMKAFHKS